MQKKLQISKEIYLQNNYNHYLQCQTIKTQVSQA